MGDQYLAGRDDIISARFAAFHYIVEAITGNDTLPEQVFSANWGQFFFFESDRIFAPSFAAIALDLMYLEHATTCCLLNLTRTIVKEYQTAVTIFLESSITGSEYASELRRGGPEDGWLFGVDKYGCASDKGEWCIYCDKGNDLAIIGFRLSIGAKKFSAPLEKLNAVPPQSLLLSRGCPTQVPFSLMTKEWRQKLAEQYAHPAIDDQ